jgi:hypothetical protein
VHEKLLFHDLLDDEGFLLGCVCEDKRTHNSFTPSTNDHYLAKFPTQSTLKEAKALLVAHFVAKKLEDTTT